MYLDIVSSLFLLPFQHVWYRTPTEAGTVTSAPHIRLGLTNYQNTKLLLDRNYATAQTCSSRGGFH